MESIIKLSNQLSQYTHVPNPYKLHWGHGIAVIQSAYDVMHQLGIRGTDIQQDVKQGIGAALMTFDDGYDVRYPNRRKLLHISGDLQKFCNEGKSHTNASYVSALYIFIHIHTYSCMINLSIYLYLYIIPCDMNNMHTLIRGLQQLFATCIGISG